MNIGIYKITNILNNKCYIGSSQAVKQRLLKHKRLLTRNIHHSIKLQNSVNKYGIENFMFELIEECQIDKLIEREQYYIDNSNSEYNILKIADSHRGIKRSQETKDKIGLYHKGKVVSQESRNKMSEAFKGRKLSKETLLKRKNTMTGKYHKEGKHLKPVYMLDLEENIINKFDTIRQASRETSINRVSIGSVCGSKAITAGGYKWRFVND